MNTGFIHKIPCRSLLLKKVSPLFLIFTLAFVSSCLSMHEIHDSASDILLRAVPFYPQESYQCGPASLAMVMNYRNVLVKPEEIAEDIYSRSARGTLNLDMVLYAQHKGLSALQYKGNLNDLKKNIDSGNPLVVLVDYGFSFYQSAHFMVVVGYNEKGVIVNSGKMKEHFIPEKEFMKAWEKTNYWTLLIQQRDTEHGA